MQPAGSVPEITRPSKPSFRKKAVLLGTVLLIVIIAGSTTYYLTRNAPSPTAPAPASPYSLQITRVAQYGNTTWANEYYLSINATYSGDTSWQLNPVHFKLVSSTSNVYSAVGRESTLLGTEAVGIHLLQAVDLLHGEHAGGQIIFKLPTGQTPAKLRYYDSLATISVEVTVPQVSSWISGPFFALQATIQGGGNLYVAWGYRLGPGMPQQPGTSQGSYQMAVYTGDTVLITLGIVYFNSTGDPGSITVSGITDTNNAYTISNMQPTPPFSVLGAGACCSAPAGREVDVAVNFKAPSFSYASLGYADSVTITINVTH